MARKQEQPSRYTPPTPKSAKRSGLWMLTAIFTCFIVGILVILLNYTGVFPGGAQNQYMLVGLAEIMGGLVLATQYR